MMTLPDVDLLGGPTDAVPVLLAFWVGEQDTFAAYSDAHALELCNEQGGTDTEDTFTLDDVSPVSDEDLAKPIHEDGEPFGTLGELLAAMTAPGYLVGFE